MLLFGDGDTISVFRKFCNKMSYCQLFFFLILCEERSPVALTADIYEKEKLGHVLKVNF